MTLAAKNPSSEAALRDLAAELAQLAGSLTTLLAQETEFVRALRVKEIGPLQAEKTRLTAAYQSSFKALTGTYDAKSLPPDIRDVLAAAGQRLAAAVIDNELALRVGKAATERLIGSIIDAVKEQRKSVTVYAPGAPAARHTFMTAAAVDRHL